MIKLSVIIPTKNRQKYCIAAIEQILQLNLQDIEIIVQDNSEDDSLRNNIANLCASNIIYNYHPGTLSFVDNFSEPLSYARGQYVCMIGDDDGLLPNIENIINFSIEKDIDAIIPSLDIVYFWPSVNPFIHKGENGYMYATKKKCNFKYVDVHDGLLALMRSGGQDYQELNIPRVYHGIVKLSRLRDVRNYTGCYFDGLSPDIYMAVALSFVCKKVIRLNFPVTISGICPRSGSSDSATGKHTGELKDAPHFNGHESYKWDCKAPYIYSVESIWAETVLHALHNFNREDIYALFSVRALDSICYGLYPQFRNRIIRHAKEFGVSKLMLILTYKIYELKKFLQPRWRILIARTLKRDEITKTYYDLPTILHAYKKVKDLPSFMP